MDLALNNLQRLICHKTQQTKPTKYLSLFSLSLIFTLSSVGTGKFTKWQILFFFFFLFFLINTKSALLIAIRKSVCISKFWQIFVVFLRGSALILKRLNNENTFKTCNLTLKFLLHSSLICFLFFFFSCFSFFLILFFYHKSCLKVTYVSWLILKKSN